MRWVRGGPEATDALQLVIRLVGQGLPDEQIVERLRAVPGGTRALRKAARVTESAHSYPGEQHHALLVAAAEGTPMPKMAEEKRAEHEQQRQLLMMDPAEGFALLAQQIPALLDLEERARQGVPEAEWPRMARWVRDGGRSREVGMIMLLMNTWRQLVGPDSNQQDPLLASVAAEATVRRHLARVTGALPVRDEQP